MKVPLTKEERHQKSTASFIAALEDFKDTPNRDQFTPEFPFNRVVYSSLLDKETPVEIYNVPNGDSTLVEMRLPEILRTGAN